MQDKQFHVLVHVSLQNSKYKLHLFHIHALKGICIMQQTKKCTPVTYIPFMCMCCFVELYKNARHKLVVLLIQIINVLEVFYVIVFLCCEMETNICSDLSQ